MVKRITGYGKTSKNLTKYSWVKRGGKWKRLAVKTPRYSSSAYKPRGGK